MCFLHKVPRETIAIIAHPGSEEQEYISYKYRNKVPSWLAHYRRDSGISTLCTALDFQLGGLNFLQLHTDCCSERVQSEEPTSKYHSKRLEFFLESVRNTLITFL